MYLYKYVLLPFWGLSCDGLRSLYIYIFFCEISTSSFLFRVWLVIIEVRARLGSASTDHTTDRIRMLFWGIEDDWTGWDLVERKVMKYVIVVVGFSCKITINGPLNYYLFTSNNVQIHMILTRSCMYIHVQYSTDQDIQAPKYLKLFHCFIVYNESHFLSICQNRDSALLLIFILFLWVLVFDGLSVFPTAHSHNIR